ncbi:OsmC family protein [Anaeromyxobacter dehalogenans]|uniref:OsmC-like protein n=1 Tax=Anaeromyxobacter dehalogenans (strain 2CP-C) TaxID=290397 RepID=Q2IN40_ANADE|nr:OsmC family protein [Anaeromyxobacter dehalogenans]ABC80219.1 OsmC-like protein [Anaeromyxobacter dehalogenans 2CP-C]
MTQHVKAAIEGLAAAVTAEPHRARATFRATTISEGAGLATRSVVRGFEVPLDEPRELGGTDTGPNPVEAVLAALGSCQAIVYRALAAAQGLQLERVEVVATGVLDVRGFLGAAPVSPGFERVTFRTRLTSPEPLERLRALARQVEAQCPVLDVLQRPLDVRGELELVSIPAAGRAA